jgi:hypothetical protein
MSWMPVTTAALLDKQLQLTCCCIRCAMSSVMSQRTLIDEIPLAGLRVREGLGKQAVQSPASNFTAPTNGKQLQDPQHVSLTSTWIYDW